MQCLSIEESNHAFIRETRTSGKEGVRDMMIEAVSNGDLPPPPQQHHPLSSMPIMLGEDPEVEIKALKKLLSFLFLSIHILKNLYFLIFFVLFLS